MGSRWRWGVAAACLLAADPASALVSTVRVASGLSRPVFATAPPGDYGRLFIVELHTGALRTARIKILDLVTGQISPTPFLSIDNVAIGAEQGLLGLAFHPDYANNGQFFVDYVDSTGAIRVERYQVSSNGGVADPTPTRLLTIGKPQPNHNGGWIGFGPDGYLYVGTGDGGGGNDVGPGHTEGIGNAQDLTDNQLGKILRLDVDHPANGLAYGIPESNPFVGKEGDDEIWAFGLRNPWRPSFDRETGDLWIADVGQNAKEEVNFQPADSPGGENYGWRLREGTIPTPTPTSAPVGGEKPPGAIDPIHEYDHTTALPVRSITGGYVYRGPIEELQGRYFFADFQDANTRIWSLRFDGSDPADFDGTNFIEFTDWTQLLPPDVGSIRWVSSFAEDAAGNLYLIDLGGGFDGQGEIYRVVPEPASATLMGVAMAALAAARRRGRRAAPS
ncbi:MAG TPA: PQQ-dependent sugar dehydrogenase [Myxococcota bacterium]|jgi:glucose/arabinose dehydrogenase